MPRAGPSSKRIDQIVNLARTHLKRRLIASWEKIKDRCVVEQAWAADLMRPVCRLT